jgi:hypothetical protein
MATAVGPLALSVTAFRMNSRRQDKADALALTPRGAHARRLNLVMARRLAKPAFGAARILTGVTPQKRVLTLNDVEYSPASAQQTSSLPV